MSKHKQANIFTFILILFLQFAGIRIANGEQTSLRCPEPRNTQKAPPEYYNLINPLEANTENIKKGKMLYQMKAKPMACKYCHGKTGDGNGPMAKGINPPPRNFTCAKTINGVPDGQLFWIIKNGSPETEMFSYNKLKDDEIWKIILYIRQLAH